MSTETPWDRIEGKLDRLLERQDALWEAYDELTPVVRLGLAGVAEHLGAAEQRGWFAFGRELVELGDRVVSAYGPDDVRALADQIVSILDTVRNATQPDVLALANEAVDVVHHADQVDPVGMFGAMRATRDEDVQRGIGVALEVLRHIGRARGRSAMAPPRTVPAALAAPMAAASPTPKQSLPAASGPVMWEGVAFDAQGFLLDPGDWTEGLAEKMAAALGVALSEEHWTVLRWIRADFTAAGASPNVRRVATGSGVGTKRMYELFPRTPGKTAAMLAGVPKPVGCV